MAGCEKPRTQPAAKTYSGTAAQSQRHPASCIRAALGHWLALLRTCCSVADSSRQDPLQIEATRCLTVFRPRRCICRHVIKLARPRAQLPKPRVSDSRLGRLLEAVAPAPPAAKRSSSAVRRSLCRPSCPGGAAAVSAAALSPAGAASSSAPPAGRQSCAAAASRSGSRLDTRCSSCTACPKPPGGRLPGGRACTRFVTSCASQTNTRGGRCMLVGIPTHSTSPQRL